LLPFVFRIVKEAVPLPFSLVGHPNLSNENVSDHVKRIKGQKTFKLRFPKTFCADTLDRLTPLLFLLLPNKGAKSFPLGERIRFRRQKEEKDDEEKCLRDGDGKNYGRA
jgi:hypothetical protein